MAGRGPSPVQLLCPNGEVLTLVNMTSGAIDAGHSDARSVVGFYCTFEIYFYGSVAWSRPETLLKCLELPKGTPEGAMAGLGARAVQASLMYSVLKRERERERELKNVIAECDHVARTRCPLRRALTASLQACTPRAKI
jgi:hypothetical protein